MTTGCASCHGIAGFMGCPIQPSVAHEFRITLFRRLMTFRSPPMMTFQSPPGIPLVTRPSCVDLSEAEPHGSVLFQTRLKSFFPKIDELQLFNPGEQPFTQLHQNESPIEKSAISVDSFYTQ
jgi:hypothetical protein